MTAITAGTRQRTGLAALLGVLGLLAAFPPLGTDMYLPGLVPIARDLGAPVTAVQLTLSAFLAGIAAGHLVLGPMSDRHGRRVTLLACLAACAVAGVLCVLAPTVWVLVAARLVQGFTAAAGVVIGRAVVLDLSRGRDATRLFAALTAVLAVTPVLAPLAGGVLAATVGWRAVFAVLALISLLTLAAALVALPETLPRRLRRRGSLAASLPEALALLRDRVYLGHALALALAFGALTAYAAAAPFVLTQVFRLSTAALSLTLAVNALALVTMAALSARLVYRLSSRRLLEAGLAVLLAASAALYVLAVAGRLPAAAFLPLLLVAVASLGPVLGDAAAIALQRASHAPATGAALLGTLQFGVGALAAPLAGLNGDRTAVLMPLVMGACAALALLAFALTGAAGRLAEGGAADARDVGARSRDPR
ncbi:Bcr/CflA family efflux MFS transporter [Sphaerisporangium sp. TRM90804]|uniref:Bcr/CflA family efflux MFS transporter n=1 Tax=Sphaerisporangium sp. TRM90804 TaxID=3031113 RepID=UPI00244A11CC|nr:Bcr/CflA family efflux MFS transporter [Sphaerisporangium sp. TRM90804]MDH2424017.1 Bcr/CflA family efflux MFS transporter [Sphaerisporangium sp. TRM90804]